MDTALPQLAGPDPHSPPGNPSVTVAPPLIQAENLKTFFPVTGGVFRKTVGHVKAVNGVSLEIGAGEVVSVVGESGCGKSTLGYSLLGLTLPTAGILRLNGQALDITRTSSWTPYRKDFQIVFQDPYTSLNPRHTVLEILSGPMRAHGLVDARHARDAVAALLAKVGLPPDYMHRFPHAFSGGQRQRLGIARALGLKPKLIVCDEVVAALDVSVQAQIVQLLMELRAELGLSLLFISHDLSLVKSISDKVLVMYLGKIVEAAEAQALFVAPRHPYSAALLESIPTLDRARKPKLLGGEIPSPVDLPPGCAFAGRCPSAQIRCREETPVLRSLNVTQAACHYPLADAAELNLSGPTRV